jgi:hypothetical protein
MKKATRMSIYGWLIILVITGCHPGTPATPDTGVVTVVETVPVEVTRLVEVPITVEVTRQVVVNQTVQIPVTIIPTTEAIPTQIPTPIPVVSTSIPPSPTPTFPLEKVEGYSVLLVVNETSDDILVNIDGPISRSFPFKGQSKILEKVKEGEYTYMVIRDESVIYQGKFNITNPDKFELHIRANKVVFFMP